MVYVLFLFRPRSKKAQEAISMIRRDALIDNEIDQLLTEEILDFNADEVADEIQKKVCDKAKVGVRFANYLRQYPYLRIGTSYERIKEVLPEAIAAAYKYHLLLWDNEMRKALDASEFIEDSYIHAKNRAKQLRVPIRNSWYDKKFYYHCLPIWPEIYKDRTWKNESTLAYVYTMRKGKDKSFAERVKEFQQLLLSCLQPNEKLICDKPCFTVDGGQYSIVFYLEGYKRANLLGYMENGQPVISLMHRMNYKDMQDWLYDATDEDYRETLQRLADEDMVKNYSDPLERLWISIKTTKKIKKAAAKARNPMTNEIKKLPKTEDGRE